MNPPDWERRHWCAGNGYVNVRCHDGGGRGAARGEWSARRHALVVLTGLGSGAAALAQDRPGAGEILIDATGPDAHHERRTVPLPPEGPEREAFMREFLVVDLHEN